MKQNLITIGLIASVLTSCENVTQMVNNINNEISESTERIENEINQSTEKIASDVMKNVDLQAFTDQLLNTKHLESIENMALKLVEYQNIADRIANLKENIVGGELGALEILAITQFAKSTQQELIKLREGATTPDTQQKIDSLLRRYENMLNAYPQQNNREENRFSPENDHDNEDFED